MENQFSKINPVRGRAPRGARSTRLLARAASNGIKLIIGLGNPEPEYDNTYHNAGKLMVDYLLKKLVSGGVSKAACFHKKTSGNFESCTVCDFRLVKPTNYMNENGKAAKAALKSFGTKADSLLVAHDDSDIEIGTYKTSFGSGSAGHNGVQSVIENMGTKNFWRLRIGIRPSPRNSALSQRRSALRPKADLPAEVRRTKAGEFVLKKITDADDKLMCSAFEKAFEELFGKKAI
ncbi:MAG: aminoacyl-tRNA hydrolase [Candidatus Liptonbacteria bacterium]|nr:aminoacyl-tRNA hydrolase [Candidatus Liptonbacteria bacterium]